MDLTLREKLRLLRDGHYVINSVAYSSCTARWTEEDWVDAIDMYGAWTPPTEG